MTRSTWAPDWTEAEREHWIVDYRADRPVLMPVAEHWQDECEHCELLLELMREADRRDDEEECGETLSARHKGGDEMADPSRSVCRPEDCGYYAHDCDQAYVCWDCATSEERNDPVTPEWDVQDCSCVRCGVWWEAVDGIEAESPKRLWHRDRYQALDGAARTMVAVATATYHGPDAGYRRVAAMNVAVTRLQEALDA